MSHFNQAAFGMVLFAVTLAVMLSALWLVARP